MEKTIKFTKSGVVTTVYVEHGFTENVVITSSKIDEIGTVTPASGAEGFHETATGFEAVITSATYTGDHWKKGWFRTFGEAVGHIVAHSGALTE
jgi:hypothetical protein